MNLPSTAAVLAAALLSCGAASAQPASAPAQSPASDTPAPGPTSTTTVGADGVRNTLVASSPVPDTPENRAKYGKPMSHAGRHTKAAGN